MEDIVKTPEWPGSHLWFLNFLKNDVVLIIAQIKHLWRDGWLKKYAGRTCRTQTWTSMKFFDKIFEWVRAPASIWPARKKKDALCRRKIRLQFLAWHHLNGRNISQMNISKQCDCTLMCNQVWAKRICSDYYSLLTTSNNAGISVNNRDLIESDR